MSSKLPFAVIPVLALGFAHCSSAAITVTAKNDSDLQRTTETVEVPWSELAKALPPKTKPDHVLVTDPSGKKIVAQPIYLEGQKKPAAELIFQSDFGPSESKSFTIEPGQPEPYEPKVYCRWVPERFDDFAWESDKIAYRIYGPQLEIVEPASSGVDVWPKRTPNLIVNKWYQIAQSINSNYYHYDHGEGLDCYKVGHTQGCGGTAIWANGKLFTTGIKGWKTQKVLANGPIRLVFELTYDPINVNGTNVSEVKRVTLDAGHNLNHYESTFTTDKPMDNLVIVSGIGEHQDRPYETQFHKDQGWMSYWDAGDNPGEKKPTPDAPDGHVGCAVVMPNGQALDTFEVNHVMEMSTKATPGQPVSFWAGAGWDKSGDFSSYDDWNKYLEQWAKRVSSPLKVSVSQ